MQEFSTGRYPVFIETPVPIIGDPRIGGVGGIAHRLSFFVGSVLGTLLGNIGKVRFQSRSAYLANRNEIEIMYFGRTGESLKLASERMVIPAGSHTVGKLLCSLYKRGDRWVDELDDSHLMCTVNGRKAGLFDTIAPGAEICFSSNRES
jgi:hypothetical protein